jgi:hypothetical protein
VIERECDNCAIADADLIAVRRVYLIPAAWDTPASQQVVADVEHWCVSCWSQYPNEPVDPNDPVQTPRT